MDNFRRWINSIGGIDAAAEAIGTTRFSLVNWLGRRCSPKLELVVAICHASNGKVTPADILKATKRLPAAKGLKK